MQLVDPTFKVTKEESSSPSNCIWVIELSEGVFEIEVSNKMATIGLWEKREVPATTLVWHRRDEWGIEGMAQETHHSGESADSLCWLLYGVKVLGWMLGHAHY